MPDITHVFAAEIVKSKRDEDGNLIVTGKATDSSIDDVEQVCDPDWLKRAMPEWFSWGNVREMHDKVAAGVATEYEAKDDGHYITVKVVDPNSAKKVEEKVLKGFSVGIKGPRIVKDAAAKNGRIVDGKIVEVSLVDRPANQNCKLMLAKAAGEDLTQVEELIEKADIPAESSEEQPADIVAIFKEIAGLDKDQIVERLVASYNVESYKAQLPDLEKLDTSQVPAVRQAIGAIAQLIASEAADAAAGVDERASIRTLTDAYCALIYFLREEAFETGILPSTPEAVSDALQSVPLPGGVGEATITNNAAEADVTKTETTTETTTKSDEPTGSEEQPKAEPSNNAEDLAKQIAQHLGLDSIKATLEKFEERVAKVEKAAVPSGPVRVATTTLEQADETKSIEAEVRKFEHLAETTQDRNLAAGYAKLAKEKAAQLKERSNA